jgi:sterol desaturase/sphingolipid hydroxylase (fatty acid hydroxylase superfamily)
MMEAEHISKLIPAFVLFVLGILEALGGLYFDRKRSNNDFAIELVSLATLPTLIQPGIFLVTFWVMHFFFPHLENRYMHVHSVFQVIAFLIMDDMVQYWWHRLSHQNRTMWKLHRPHHVVEEMGVLVTYRNAILYYALMPGIWFSGLLIYIGFGYVYLFYVTIKLVVILLAHSETKWDRFLYTYKVLHPIAWLIERTISTPSTHFAHHGLTAEDGISNPNGNFGNLLFFWDILFGTAKITRQYPKKFGAWNQLKEPWHIQLLFPLFRSKNERSELHAWRTKNDYDPSIDFKHFKK